MKTLTLLPLLSCLFHISAIAQGTWTKLVNPAPDYNHGVMLLLSDGTVICKTSAGGPDSYGSGWDKLTPDITGSYVNGTWTQISPMASSRLYFSSQVLKDGRVYLAGGEYGTGRNLGEIYDPLQDAWFSAGPISVGDTLSDANSEILENGNILQAVVLSYNTVSNHTYLFNPKTNIYTTGPTTLASDNESAWVKLPDNSIIYENTNSTNTERYIPALNQWIPDSSLPVELYDPYGWETGAAFLLPNGNAFFLGSTSTSAIYAPSGSAAPGHWTAAAIIPDSLGAPDAAAAMMVNGRVLCALSHTPVFDTVFNGPTYYYEYDYILDSFIKVTAPSPGIHINDTFSGPSFFSNMLCLPNGNILYGSQGDDQYYVYTPGSGPLASGKPSISSVIKINCDTFMITGRLFNGITEGAGYGDDWQMASNYPLVRLTSNDTVIYARTYNWNSTGVMRGLKADTAMFSLQDGLTVETYGLQVVANGNASNPVSFNLCSYLSVPNTLASNASVSVFPNPANGQVSVSFDSKTGGTYDIKLQDIYGRMVMDKKGIALAGSNTIELQLKGIKAGIYTLNLRESNTVYTTKLEVEE